MKALVAVIAAAPAVAGCSSAAPAPVAEGPRIEGAVAAVWPARGPARQTAFNRNGTRLALSDASGVIMVRDTRDWTVLEQFTHPGGATSLAFSADGSRLFTGGYDATVREWDLATRRIVRTRSGAKGAVWTLDLSPDGRQLAAAGEDAVIRLWRTDGQGPPRELRGHTRNIWAVRFSPDGKQLASGSFDATARLWDVSSGREVRTLTGHDEAIVGLAYSPDGKTLATGADDSTIRLWRASDGAALRTLDNGKHVDTVAFSRDGKWLITGGHARGTAAELWHKLTGVGGSGDSVRVWRTSDDAAVEVLPHPDDVIGVTLSRDGRWLVTSGEDSKFRLWRLRPVEGK